MKPILTFAVALIVALAAPSTSRAAELWRATGFKAPESVLYDQAHNRLIVSNINGTPLDVDGNGYLSLLSLDGKIIAESWATGMDAPKGMAIAGNRLYVADITKLRVIDLETGKVVESIPMEGAIFLNDVTVSASGEVYITDMVANAIYAYRNGKAELWLKDDKLNMPNGVIVEGEHLLIGTWGVGMHKDFTTDTPGGLITVSIATKAITPVANAERFGNMDGIVQVDGAILATDFIAGVVWRYSAGKAPEKIATLKPGTADLGTDGKTLFIPMMMEGEVVAMPVR